ncbi:MAG: hypothetical protein HQL60_06355 [Magnetococcales bacterium]|nr:hypothetical protein [Magnetococcales bacterium]
MPQRHQAIVTVLEAIEEKPVDIGYVRSWPAGYFAQTYGSIPDLLEREFQGIEEMREPLE